MARASDPGGGPAPEPGDVRRAFARIATNVAIVTTSGPWGSTANVWAEAPDPPVLLVTLARARETHARVAAAGRFAVNLLADDQADLARRFAGPPERRFAGVAVQTGALGLPLLEGTLAAMECTVEGTHWFGAYDIFVGRVEAARVRDDGGPLLFGDGRFQTARPPGGERG